MAYKRMIVELGYGVDMMGDNVNNAVQYAVENALEHSYVPGLQDIFGMDAEDMKIKYKADIYAPEPEDVVPQVVKKVLSPRDVEVRTHKGGAHPEGVLEKGFKKGKAAFVVIAVLTIYADIPDFKDLMREHHRK